MSVFSNIFPEQIIASIQSAALPLLALLLLAALLLAFKPLLSGILRALVLTFKPRMTKEQRIAHIHQRDAMTIHRMASAMDGASYNMTAELRAMAARG